MHIMCAFEVPDRYFSIFLALESRPSDTYVSVPVNKGERKKPFLEFERSSHRIHRDQFMNRGQEHLFPHPKPFHFTYSVPFPS